MRTSAVLFVIALSAIASVALAQHHGATHPTAATAHPTAASSADASASGDAAAAPAANGQPTTFDIPMVQRGAGVVSHYPLPEQLARNDVPVFVQVRSSAPIDHVSLFYRTQGSPRFTELRMTSMGQDVGLPGGYGAAIPCEDAFPPAVEYFVQAMDTSGAAIGSAGAAIAPIRLPIVRERQFAMVPTLPGQPPPRNCGSLEVTVPAHGPGTTAARDAGAEQESGGTADLGEPCTRNNDCRHGLRCGSNHHCVFTQSQ